MYKKSPYFQGKNYKIFLVKETEGPVSLQISLEDASTTLSVALSNSLIHMDPENKEPIMTVHQYDWEIENVIILLKLAVILPQK